MSGNAHLSPGQRRKLGVGSGRWSARAYLSGRVVGRLPHGRALYVENYSGIRCICVCRCVRVCVCLSICLYSVSVSFSLSLCLSLSLLSLFLFHPLFLYPSVRIIFASALSLSLSLSHRVCLSTSTVSFSVLFPLSLSVCPFLSQSLAVFFSSIYWDRSGLGCFCILKQTAEVSITD